MDSFVEVTVKVSRRGSMSFEGLTTWVREGLRQKGLSAGLLSRTVIHPRSLGESLWTVNRAVTGKKTHRDQFFRRRSSGSMVSVVRRVPLSELRGLLGFLEAGWRDSVVSVETWTRARRPRGEE